MTEPVPRPIRVGVLLCDDLHEGLVSRWRSYLALFQDLLADAAGDLQATGWRVHAGEWPDSPEAADAWLVSGSRASVHEVPEWVPPLQDLVREIEAAGQPLVGVCFGHQLVHSALGGRIGRATVGWGLGVYDVRLEADLAGRRAGEPLRLLSVHQDQVLTPAPGFRRLATSPFCPWYASRRGPVLTVQGHPEFDREFFQALLPQVRPKAGDAVVDRALASLPPEDDTGAFRRLLRDWLRGNAAADLQPTG
ncbi:type 1 glutamine amidotransferase [Spiribacter halobius]|uniref:Glutamine amidotransferase n=1 Tax=Sediminicurvatus halobius TaxID=2182432 RepID=A0A2U2N6E4_9GAMM|nr:glutamine amidotransferase [Spiribacter halobius]PWG64668.1 glutamine amidotransferase [Spiribacter halobius]UEX79008.1 hypothetical protein LMH63_05030 [Spiribacter halobius]